MLAIVVSPGVVIARGPVCGAVLDGGRQRLACELSADQPDANESHRPLTQPEPENRANPLITRGFVRYGSWNAYSGGLGGAICRISQSAITVTSARAETAFVRSHVGSLIAGNGPRDGSGK